jgi:hypothetical protein
MNYELGGAFIGQLIANDQLNEMLYGTATTKNRSIFSIVKMLFK